MSERVKGIKERILCDDGIDVDLNREDALFLVERIEELEGDRQFCFERLNAAKKRIDELSEQLEARKPKDR